MKEWLVDTNVLLDVLGADPHFGERSKAALVACATTGVLVINPVIFAEVGVMIDSLEELNVLLPETLFRRDPLPWEAAFLAGRAFRRYKQAEGGKRRMLADFLGLLEVVWVYLDHFRALATCRSGLSGAGIPRLAVRMHVAG